MSLSVTAAAAMPTSAADATGALSNPARGGPLSSSSSSSSSFPTSASSKAAAAVGGHGASSAGLQFFLPGAGALPSSVSATAYATAASIAASPLNGDLFLARPLDQVAVSALRLAEKEQLHAPLDAVPAFAAGAATAVGALRVLDGSSGYFFSDAESTSSACLARAGFDYAGLRREIFALAAPESRGTTTSAVLPSYAEPHDATGRGSLMASSSEVAAAQSAAAGCAEQQQSAFGITHQAYVNQRGRFDVTTFLGRIHDDVIMSALENSMSLTTLDADLSAIQSQNALWNSTSRRNLYTMLAPRLSSLDIDSILMSSSSYKARNSVSSDFPLSSSSSSSSSSFPFATAATANAASAFAATINEDAGLIRTSSASMGLWGMSPECMGMYHQAVELMNSQSTQSSSDLESPIALMAHADAINYANRNANDRCKELTSIWLLVSNLMKRANGRPLALASEYLASSYPLLESFLSESRAHLEYLFYDLIDSTVSSNPKAAMMGGDPTVEKRIEAFVRFRYCVKSVPTAASAAAASASANASDASGSQYNPEAQRSHLNRMRTSFLAPGLLFKWEIPNAELMAPKSSPDAAPLPVWAILFYMLRCGKREDAYAYACDLPLSQQDAYFPKYLALWKDGKLSDHCLSCLQSYYSALAHSENTDPFKITVYMVLAGYQALKASGWHIPFVLSAFDDWLWVRLSCIREDSYTPLDLQADLLSHEQLVEQLSMISYARVLLSVGLFERAVDRLYRVPEFQSFALHLALVLHFYGCLRIPPDCSLADPKLAASLSKDSYGHDADRSMRSNVGATSQNTSASGGFFNTTILPSHARQHDAASEKAQIVLPLRTMLTIYIASIPHLYRAAYIGRLAHYCTHDPARYESWLLAARELMIEWVRCWPLSRQLEITTACHQMLHCSSEENFRQEIVHAAARRAELADETENAVFLYAQSNDASAACDALLKLLVRTFVHDAAALGARPAAEIVADATRILSSPAFKAAAEAGGGPTAGTNYALGVRTAATASAVHAAHVLTRIVALRIPGRPAAELWREIEELNVLPVTDATVAACAAALQVHGGVAGASSRAPMMSQVAAARRGGSFSGYDAGSALGFAAKDGGWLRYLVPCVGPLLRLAVDVAVQEHIRTQSSQFAMAVFAFKRFAGIVQINLEASLHAYLAQVALQLERNARS